MNDNEVRALAAEIWTLCENFSHQWEELDSARADLPHEERGHEAEENHRILASHAVALRVIFDRYRPLEPVR